MALNIRNPEAEKLAAELATKALRDRLVRVQRELAQRGLADELEEIAEHCASLPVLEGRCAEEILGYDDNGVPR